MKKENPTFKDFFDHDEVGIAFCAGQLAEFEDMLAAGDLTASEFQELANDVLELENIDELAGSIERKVAYRKAFDALKTIVSLITAL